jgi:hypothetical protein
MAGTLVKISAIAGCAGTRLYYVIQFIEVSWPLTTNEAAAADMDAVRELATLAGVTLDDVLADAVAPGPPGPPPRRHRPARTEQHDDARRYRVGQDQGARGRNRRGAGTSAGRSSYAADGLLLLRVRHPLRIMRRT